MLTRPAPAPTTLVATGLDYSLHALHIATLSREGVVEQRVVDIARLPIKAQNEDILRALSELCWVDGQLLVLEKPWLGHDNPQSALALAHMVGTVEAYAWMVGFSVRKLAPAEWRSLAGIGTHTGPIKGVRRRELKSAAVALVKLEFGITVESDDQAEAILMGRVALSMATRERALGRS